MDRPEYSYNYIKICACFFADECQNGGTCQDGLARYKCFCVAGFGGDMCQADMDECTSNPCLNGATCNDYVNSYTCTCKPGFSGVHCQDNDNDCTARYVGFKLYSLESRSGSDN